MNLNLYGLDGPLADGRSAASPSPTTGMPGVDIMLPDIAFIEERKDRLDGLVLTHAHEDHIGAVPYLWERLGCPDLLHRTSPAAVLRRKLAEHDIKTPVADPRGRARRALPVGPFACRFVHMTHSIPEASALVIETPLRHRPAHRRLEARPGAACSASRATSSVLREARPRGRAGHGRRQHQRPQSRHLGLRGRGPGQPARADRRSPTGCVPHHLRLERRPARDRDRSPRPRRAGRSSSIGRSMRRMLDAAPRNAAI